MVASISYSLVFGCNRLQVAQNFPFLLCWVKKVSFIKSIGIPWMNCTPGRNVLWWSTNKGCHLLYKHIMKNTDSNKDGIGQFEKCITKAAACYLVFRTQFLRPEIIWIIPAQDYKLKVKHSNKALKWLRFLPQSKWIHI